MRLQLPPTRSSRRNSQQRAGVAEPLQRPLLRHIWAIPAGVWAVTRFGTTA